MSSIRKRYRITPEEEDKITKIVEAEFRGMFEATVKQNAVTFTERILATDVNSDDTFTIDYRQLISAGVLLSKIGNICTVRHIVKKRKK